MAFPNCDRHHFQVPRPEILIPDSERRSLAQYVPNMYQLVAGGHDAEDLERAVTTIVESENLTTKQLTLRYSFLADYLSAPSIDEMTQGELYDFFYNLMVQVDIYFFQGGLTQGPRSLVKLDLLEGYSLKQKAKYRTVFLRGAPGRIILYLPSFHTGKRRSKVCLLTSLVHEMTHAYLAVYFNYCPLRGQIVLVNENGGHGRTWRNIFFGICTHMRTWSQAFALMNTSLNYPVSRSFLEVYYNFAEKLPWLRAEWEVTNLRWYEPDIFKYWYWKRSFQPAGPRERLRFPARVFRALAFWRRRQTDDVTRSPKEEFKRALLRLNYEDYRHFVSTRVPYPAVPYRIWRMIRATVILLAAYCLGDIVQSMGERYRKKKIIKSITKDLIVAGPLRELDDDE